MLLEVIIASLAFLILFASWFVLPERAHQSRELEDAEPQQGKPATPTAI
jgi:hypothetical protein